MRKKNEKKIKPELWAMIEDLQQEEKLLWQFLEEKNLYSEAEEYVRRKKEEKIELPVD